MFLQLWTPLVVLAGFLPYILGIAIIWRIVVALERRTAAQADIGRVLDAARAARADGAILVAEARTLVRDLQHGGTHAGGGR
ncbi:MAG TPA: hypothetical protein VFN90_06305 [Gemmatimonadales bacterium]|nr:hypothetical protein [Gemmatimonadales bacterium]